MSITVWQGLTIAAAVVGTCLGLHIISPVVGRYLRRRLCEDDVLAGEEPRADFALDGCGKFARAYLLAKRYGDGYMIHVSEDGVVAAVEAVEGCLAFFAGVKDFWQFVGTDKFALELASKLVDELKRGYGERPLTRIHGANGESYLTSVGFPENVHYPYFAHVITAKEFIERLEDKRENGDE